MVIHEFICNYVYFRDEIKILNRYKSEIFDRKENIKRLVLDLPAHPLIQKRLTNVEDSNITGCYYTDKYFCHDNLFINNFHDNFFTLQYGKEAFSRKSNIYIRRIKNWTN